VVIGSVQGTSLFGSSTAPARLKDEIMDTSLSNNFGSDYSGVVTRSIGATGTINGAFSSAVATGVAAPSAFTNPITGQTETNTLALQLQNVAKMVASSTSLGLKRQVFFVSLGGWDTHDFQNTAQPNLLAKVAHALAYFDTALSNIGGVDRRSSVTAFTASDFSRSMTTNGDGTDHAWGSHHLIMGGAVKGGDFYGTFPTLAVNGPDDGTGQGRWVPTTSVDQYAATLASWFGVTVADLPSIFPNLANFPTQTLGIMG
jgi:uncharacterized protein (DUF1501 family)